MSGVVVIKTANGPVRIDASDYDETKHELHVADEHHDADGVARSKFTAPAGPIKATPSEVAAIAKIMAPATETTQTNAAPARNFDAFGVLQNKKKFFIVDGANGGKVVDDVEGVNPQGYDSNTDAWTVLLALKAKPAADNA